MKYDRPVHELLDECARSLPAPFTRAQISAWFRRHYPDVRETTLSTHIAGLTVVGDETQGRHQFAGKRAVLRRVATGLYAPAGGTAGVQAIEPDLPTVTHPHGARGDVVLIGCVKSKLARAAPARELYTGTLFTRRLAYAQRSGVPWFVVSGRWGLVDPDEVIAPYDLDLGAMPAAYRRGWAAFVGAQLEMALGQASGTLVEVHAGHHYVEALRPVLRVMGAVLSDPVVAGSMGETLAWYDRRGSDGYGGADLASEAAAFLGAADNAVTATALRTDHLGSLDAPGLYSWWVDEKGAEDLSAGLGLTISAGLVYAGLAGAARASGDLSTNTLRGRLVGMHLGGRVRFSTFRRTLMAILLQAPAGVWDEASLTQWMERHLSVVTLPVSDARALGALESEVLLALDPPLNLSKVQPTAVRREISRLRTAQRDDA
ncbi:hypothetical protein Q9R32_12990 [Actinotalea sp. AC32]|nr:hypothetical protein [Actinotalea sp. AC32]